MAMPLWRETFRSPRVWKLDARVSFFLLPPLMPIFRLETSLLMVGALVTLYIVEVRYGMSFPSAIRYVRAKMAGRVRRPTGRTYALVDLHEAEVAYAAKQRDEVREINRNVFTRALKAVGVDAGIHTRKTGERSK
ncbi:IcmT/TraK family protein [Acetobacter malorum]|nr:IcmT/TraK family protein [Acetobacter malorum]